MPRSRSGSATPPLLALFAEARARETEAGEAPTPGRPADPEGATAGPARRRMPAQFDVIVTNPPFQDTVRRGKTPHKLWIDFTHAIFDRFLKPGGLLCQVSPSSFCSPSNTILDLMKQQQTLVLRYDTSRHFPLVGSTFADYVIRKAPNAGGLTRVVHQDRDAPMALTDDLYYIPNDLVPTAVSIHRKVIFDRSTPRLLVEKDYVTCHNINLKRSDTLSQTRTERHIHPVFHTNRQTWWSSLRQGWAGSPKVMWTRSGYTRPFYDPGELGGTDMVYYTRVPDRAAGETLAWNMNLRLMRYIYATAKWSGFGNERVFARLPQLPTDQRLDDEALYARFQLTPEEVAHVRSSVADDR